MDCYTSVRAHNQSIKPGKTIRNSMRPSFYHHLHPPTIPEQQAKFRFTLGAGGLSVLLALIVCLTGILEMFYYIPTPAEAALSIQKITYLVPFGGLVRNMHYWSAQLLVLTTLLHLIRVIFTGAYTKPRRFNYVLGSALLLVVILLDFTGYILRWDEGVRWALVTGTNLVKSIPWAGSGFYRLVVGGEQPGTATLIRFYAWHIFGLTLIFIILGVWHIFRVRRDGGIAVPPPHLRADSSRISRFELVRREGVATVLATAGLIFLSVYFPAPIAPPISDTLLSTSNVKAPWFFLWVQKMLAWGDPFWLGVFVPFGILLLIAFIPYFLQGVNPNELGRWLPASGRPAQFITALIVIGILVLTLLQILQD